MPRTKITKKSKRNRQVEREEMIRNCEAVIDEYKDAHTQIYHACISEVDSRINRLKARMSQQLLNMRIGDFREMGLLKFADYESVKLAQSRSTLSKSLVSSNLSMGGVTPAKISNRFDEGYSTDQSRSSNAAAGLYVVHSQAGFLHQQLRGRTPGPLSSAKAQRRPRRSKSLCGDAPLISGSAKKNMPLLMPPSVHPPRSKIRTPQVQRSKAFSADRISRTNCSPPGSPPTAILRWAKPGELVMSKCGSPVVGQVMSERFANCNIPVKNGVLSLQPKKLTEINPELIDNLKPDTITQIKTLCSNLNLILNLAENKENSN